MSRKEPDFVVTDRRKFTEEGELRPGAQSEAPAEAPAAKATAEPAADQPRVVSEKFSKEDMEQTLRGVPTAAEQQAGHTHYQAGTKKLDDLLREKTGQSVPAAEMNFERLIASLYMSAMVQLGAMAPEGEQPRVDILGARQTIDMLGILNEKTRGNLSAAEQQLLQNSLFELRMAFVEITNAIARGPVSPPPGAKK